MSGPVYCTVVRISITVARGGTAYTIPSRFLSHPVSYDIVPPMDKLVSRIVDLFSFLADVLTVLFVIHSLSGLTFRQMLSRLAMRENLVKAWNLYTEFLRTLDGYGGAGEKSPQPVRIITAITPQPGTLSFLGHSPSLSCQVLATLGS